jgi:ankyrin repeat protein
MSRISESVGRFSGDHHWPVLGDPRGWAANVDFGDTAAVELLLKAGANPATRNADGLTPLQVAVKYGHSRHELVLRRVTTGQADR